VEHRDGRLHVFLPPLQHLEHAVELLAGLPCVWRSHDIEALPYDRLREKRPVVRVVVDGDQDGSLLFLWLRPQQPAHGLHQILIRAQVAAGAGGAARADVGEAGAGAAAALYTQAGGSVHVNQPDVVTPLAAITERAARSGDAVTYDDGTNVQAAAALAKTADVAIVYAGYGPGGVLGVIVVVVVVLFVMGRL